MDKKSSAAGGIFLLGGFVGGFFYGLVAQDVVKWSLIGLAGGALLAILIWLKVNPASFVPGESAIDKQEAAARARG